MSKEPEETLDVQNDTADVSDDAVSDADSAKAEDSAVTEAETDEASADDAQEDADAEEDIEEDAAETQDMTETVLPANQKILAIKSALRKREEEQQQEETKQAIADKIRKYKSAKENPSEAPAEQQEAAKEEAPAQESAKAEPKAAVKKSKKSKKKKSKKKKKTFGQMVLGLFPQKGDGALEVIRKCVFLSSSAVFVVCLALIGNYFWQNYDNARMNDGLEEIYNIPEVTDTTEETSAVEEDYEHYFLLQGAERLLAINPDVAGWINIPGTQINYPILQRKDQEDGNDYYLKKNIYGEKTNAGSIFLDFRNNFDYVIDEKKQCENSTNLIIYGHNMHDYSMFGSLKHYINNASYYSEHPIIELNSNYRQYQYKIFGMIIVDIDDETETKFDYWNQLDFADERAFYDYVNEVKRRTIRLTNVDVKYGDQLLTLSTCNSTFSDGRLVVFARLVREGEDLMAGTEESTANPNIKWPNSYYRWHKNTYDPDAEFVPYG